jgi:hypothetical protein
MISDVGRLEPSVAAMSLAAWRNLETLAGSPR